MPGEWWTAQLGLAEGCDPQSEGCDHCWAAALLRRIGRDPHEVRLFPERLKKIGTWTAPQTAFVCPLGDFFHKAIPDDFIRDALEDMGDFPQHTFIIPTKRSERLPKWRDWAPLAVPLGGDGRFAGLLVEPYIPENVMLMVSVENQEQADKRIPDLLQTPGRHGVSAEPLLGPVDLTRIDGAAIDEAYRGITLDALHGVNHRRIKIDYLVTAPESGPGRRPCELDWVRDIVGQCEAAQVPCMVKHLYQDGKKVSLPELDGRRWAALPGGAP